MGLSAGPLRWSSEGGEERGEASGGKGETRTCSEVEAQHTPLSNKRAQLKLAMM